MYPLRIALAYLNQGSRSTTSCIAPVERCFGVSPRKAAKWRADLNSVALATVATMAEAVILPAFSSTLPGQRERSPRLSKTWHIIAEPIMKLSSSRSRDAKRR